MSRNASIEIRDIYLVFLLIQILKPMKSVSFTTAACYSLLHQDLTQCKPIRAVLNLSYPFFASNLAQIGTPPGRRATLRLRGSYICQVVVFSPFVVTSTDLTSRYVCPRSCRIVSILPCLNLTVGWPRLSQIR